MIVFIISEIIFLPETELVPWKTGSQEEFDYKIPVGATLVSAAVIAIVAPIASTFINGTDSYVQTVLMNINPNLILPIMLHLHSVDFLPQNYAYFGIWKKFRQLVEA